MEPQLAKYWVIAARAGFAQKSDWQAWADKYILAMASPPIWVIDISLAADIAALQAAASRALERERFDRYESINAAQIGYLWWRRSLGQLALHEALRLAGEAADGGDSGIPCEDIYRLLNELEAEEDSVQNIEARAEAMLGPLRDVAQKQWAMIQNAVDSSA